MSTAVATHGNGGAVTAPGEIMESVIIKGDLSELTPEERSRYYLRVCESLGLNPLTKPFEYIKLNGKLTLYALRACTDQLRTLHDVSVEELAENEREGVYIVTAKVRNSKGRTDMSKGAVTIAALKGEALANAMMKAETKAKRRATLSLCGLGFLDETEVEDIPSAAKRAAPQPAPASIAPPARSAVPTADPETGEVGPRAIPVPEDERGTRLWTMWGQTYIAAHEHAESLAESDAWAAANSDVLAALAGEPKAEKFRSRLDSAVVKARERFTLPLHETVKPIETMTRGGQMLEPSDLENPANILSAG